MPGRRDTSGSGAETGGPEALPTSPLPLGRSILWTPRGSGSRGPASNHPLFVTRDVLESVTSHLAGDAEPRFGFVLGQLRRSPGSGVEFAVADAVVRAEEPLAETGSAAALVRAWSEAKPEFAAHGGRLLGWYHSHSAQGVMPTETDLDTCSRYFDEPWQFALILVPERNRPLGAVFRPGWDGPLSGIRPQPFYELLPDGEEAGDAGSAVDWVNYEMHRTGKVAPEPESAAAVAPPPEADSPDPAEGGSEAEQAGGGPSMARAAPPRESLPEEEPRLPEDEARLPEDEPRSAEGEPPLPAAADDAPGPRYAVPLVIPGEGAQTGLLPPRSRRIAWPVVVAGVVVLGVVLFLLLPRERPSPTVPAGPPPASEGASAAVQAFLDDASALGTATERYAERAADFDAGRIGCDLLIPGYVDADESYVEVAASYRALDAQASANPRAETAYETAGERIAEVNAHFDASGCPRP